MNYWENETDEFTDLNFNQPDYYEPISGSDEESEYGHENSSKYWGESSKKAKKRKLKSRMIKLSIAALVLAVVTGIILLAVGANRRKESLDQLPEEIVQNGKISDGITHPDSDAADDSNNSDYSSDGYFRYFRSQLNEDLKHDYDSILSAVETQNNTVRLETTDSERIEYIVERVHSDNPECFWLGDSYKVETIKGTGMSLSAVIFDFSCSGETVTKRQKEINTVVNPLIQSLDGLSEYEKVRSVYEYVISNTEYDPSSEDQSCYSVLVNRKGVCAGYASAMQLILNRIGIDTIFVKGTADGEKHAWNIVKIDGCWYHLDATWGDPISSDGNQYITYDYFLLTDSEMLKDHTYDKGMGYPKCNHTCEEKESDNLKEHKTLGKGVGLTVHFIDVGQADAALIVCDGEAMMVDGGNADDSQLIYSYLKSNGISRLKYIVCTHPHEDHSGGLSAAMNCCSVENIFCTMTDFDTRAFQSLKKYCQKQGIDIVLPPSGSSFKIGGAEFTVLAPIDKQLISENTSIVFRLTYGDNSFLFTGDAEYEDEQALLECGYVLKSDVLKVGHHGSFSSTGYQFLYEVNPDYAVISVGADNTYGHPDESVLSRLNDADVEVYRTDKNGTIICTCDGTNISFETEK